VRRWLFFRISGSAAPVYVCANAAINCVLVNVPYRLLISFTATVLAAPTLLFLGAFIALRIQEPQLERNFKIPGGLALAVPLAACPALLTIAQFVLTVIGDGADEAETDDPPIVLFGFVVPYPSLLCNVFIVVLGLGIHAATSCCSRQGLEARGRQGVDDEPLIGKGSSVRLDGGMAGDGEGGVEGRWRRLSVNDDHSNESRGHVS
jgi:amino acid transporter